MIKSVRIVNFRSIRNTTRGSVTHLQCNKITTFVGKNNSGKSNVLKALNLFFNGSVSQGNPFSYQRDLTYQIKNKRKLNKDISIELEIEPPVDDWISKDGNVIWTKTWDSNGGITERIIYKNSGNELKKDRRTRFYRFLKNIRFRYIPAIKSDNYFKYLMSDLYQIMSSMNTGFTFNEDTFIENLQMNTIDLSTQINSHINIDSIISYPNSFREIFTNLKFITKDSKITLDEMGDGIKIRYIPIILKYLADHEYENSDSKDPKVTTIWGFEEPENNLEIGSAQELANYFMNDIVNSGYIQLFQTTHSPVFYSLMKNDAGIVNTYFVSQNEEKLTTIERINKTNNHLDEKMDMSSLVKMSDIWSEIQLEKNQLKSIIDSQKEKIAQYSKPVCFVEGVTDKLILEHAIRSKYPTLLDRITIEAKDKDGGAEWVKRRLAAWMFEEKKIKCMAIFDNDKAGEKQYSEFSSNELLKNRYNVNKRDKLVDAIILRKFKHELLKNKFTPVITLEEFYGVKSWEHAKSKDWLVVKTEGLRKSECPGNITYEQFIRDEIERDGLNEDVFYYHYYKLDGDYKSKLANYAIANDTDLLKNLESLVDYIHKFFA